MLGCFLCHVCDNQYIVYWITLDMIGLNRYISLCWILTSSFFLLGIIFVFTTQDYLNIAWQYDTCIIQIPKWYYKAWYFYLSVSKTVFSL